MKSKLLLTLALIFAITANAQNQVSLSMGSDYSDEIFYKFSTDQSYTYPANSWELAFLRTSQFSFAIRINDGIGMEIFEASDDPTQYDNIDISNESSWTQIYNSDISWEYGALNFGSATYGFGEYAGPPNHNVYGTIVFVIKYADGTYKKLFIDEYLQGYTFTYATWDNANSTWGADTTYTLSNTTNPGRLFNYYNLTTNSEVIAEPASTDWDLKFTKYTTELNMGGSTTMYTLTGALQHPNVTIAENIEANGNGNTDNLTYSEEINTIGYDWKSFTGTGYSVDPELYYYLKYEDGTIYKIHFTSFDGDSTGNLSFNAEDVTDQLDLTEFEDENSFGFFPNPAKNYIDIIHENFTQEEVKVSIYSLSGKEVISKILKNNGFFNQRIDISKLSSGNYIVHFKSSSQLVTKKLIVN